MPGAGDSRCGSLTSGASTAAGGGATGVSPGFRLHQAYTGEPPAVMDALDDVSVELELGHDGSREVNPAGVQIGKGDWLFASLSQSLQQPLLLGVSERHRAGLSPAGGTEAQLSASRSAWTRSDRTKPL